VQTCTRFIGTTSFGFAYELRNDRGEVAATAADVMVMFDYNTNRKTAFPQIFRDRIASLDGEVPGHHRNQGSK
jgi:acyl-CoA thioesterase FadM